VRGYTSTPPFPGAMPRSFLRLLLAGEGRDPVLCGHSTASAMVMESMKVRPKSVLRPRPAHRALRTAPRAHARTRAVLRGAVWQAYMLPPAVLERAEAQALCRGVAKLQLDFLLTGCFNLGRQRRRLTHCVEDWAQLQAHADQVDQILFAATDAAGRPTLVSPAHAYFAGWLVDRALAVLDRFLELGFLLRSTPPAPGAALSSPWPLSSSSS